MSVASALPGWLRQVLKRLLRCVPPLYRLRERAVELQRANAALRHELKRLLVFDRAPGRLLTPILIERARTLRQTPAADVSARERTFVQHSPIYREVRDRVRMTDPQ